MSENVTNINGMKWVDPNPNGSYNVDHEDLTLFVKLSARPKKNTIITEEVDSDVTIAQTNTSNNGNEINYTHQDGVDYLNTDWTNIGGGTLGEGVDVGGFGIDSIDIDFTASMVPTISIKMTDIRGATLFEQGTCSPYASFFQLPYPIFELTIKGYYGQPVTYQLALLKFNTKFNPSTGNFEISCDFIGYTYAFLTDMLLGYGLAAPYMREQGEQGVLSGIWNKYRNNPKNKLEELPAEPITLIDFVKDIKTLEKTVGELLETSEFNQLDLLTGLINDCEGVNNIIRSKINTGLREYQTNIENGSIPSLGKVKLSLKGGNLKKVREDILGDNFKIDYDSQINDINSKITNNGFDELTKLKPLVEQLQPPAPRESFDSIIFGEGDNPNVTYFTDFSVLLNNNNKLITEISEKIKTKKERLKTIFNTVVTDTLGYKPTVANVMAIILSNTETFLKMLLNTSNQATIYHNNNPTQGKFIDNNPNGRLSPWPGYFESKANGGIVQEVFTYPGTKPEYQTWEEVEFVESFVDAYLDVNRILSLIRGEFNGLPGFDNYLPLNPIESPLFDTGDSEASPNGYYELLDLDSIDRKIGERAVLLADHTFVQPLFGVRTRNGLVGETSNDNSFGKPLNDLPNLNKWGSRNASITNKHTFENTLKSYGYVDAINFLNTKDGLSEVKIIDSIREKVKNVGSFKQSVKNSLGNTTNITDYITNNLGSNFNLGNVNEYLSTTNNGRLLNNEKVYSLPELNIRRENSDNIDLKPNYDNNSNFIFRISDGESDRSIKIKEGTDKEPTKLQKWLSTDETIQGFDLTNSNLFKRVTEDTKYHFLKPQGNNVKYGDGFINLDNDSKTFNLKKDDKLFYKFLDLDDLPNNDDSKSITDSVIRANLVEKELWVENLPNTVTWKKPRILGRGNNKFLSGFTQTTINGKQTDNSISRKSLAYITLITMGTDGAEQVENKNFGYSNWADDYIKYDTTTITPYFRLCGGSIEVPKGFVLLTGAILWRMKESGVLPEYTSVSNGDPIKWPSSLVTKLEPYHWPHLDNEDFNKKTLVFNPSENNYIDIRNNMKTLYYLPKSVKDSFILYFEAWVNGDFSNQYLSVIDPLNFDNNRDFEDLYNLDDDKIYPKGNNSVIRSLHNDLVENVYTIKFSTPKIFMGVSPSEYPEDFIITETQIDSFLDGWIEGFTKGYDERVKEIKESGDDDNDSILNDNDIKLDLYKSFKSIYDKWVSGSETNRLFFNNGLSDLTPTDTDQTGNNKTNEPIDDTLFRLFRFIDRAFNPIGDKVVLDVTQFKDIQNNPTNNIWNLITTSLSRNNFNTFALPGYVDFGESSVKGEIENMFRPVPFINNIKSEPTFLAMLNNSNSENLDLGNRETEEGKTNNCGFTINSKPSDSFDIDESTEALKPEGNELTGFIVSFGSENQSHFTSVNLDQAEFRETSESLKVIDRLAGGGGGNNRTFKGQNLHQVYKTRSYTCEVEGLGNMMIQPLQYFYLKNVPMFNGTYLITGVKHSLKPNHMTTSFTGVRQSKVVMPIVEDVYSIMNIVEPRDSETKGVQTTEQFLNNRNISTSFIEDSDNNTPNDSGDTQKLPPSQVGGMVI